MEISWVSQSPTRPTRTAEGSHGISQPHRGQGAPRGQRAGCVTRATERCTQGGVDWRSV